MNFEFNENINNFLKIILKNALSSNLRVFFVGGIVRDKILDVPTFDIDLLLQGNAIEFSKTLPKEITIKSIHQDFCTVKLEYNDVYIDIASSRIEKYPFSGCLPVVNEIGVDIEKDALRRDFSVNSLYSELSLVEDNIVFNLIDFVGGIQDIENKILKVLHDKSYVDDPTRIIRGLGFKYRFGFDFSQNDKKLIDEYLKNISYKNMSLDRNEKVIKNVLNSQFQAEIFKEIIEKKYYKIIVQHDVCPDFDLVEYIFDKFCLDMISMSELYLKIIYNTQIEQISFEKLVDIYKIFKKNDIVDLAYYFYKTKDEKVLKYLKIKDVALNISGDDLLELGYTQGKNIGVALNELLDEKLNNPSNFTTKKDEISWILNRFPKN